MHRFNYLLIAIGLEWCTLAMNVYAEDLKDLMVDQLVAKLVSPNKAPKETSGAPDEPFITPATYDFDAQKQMCNAAEELLDRGKDAIPELLKHYDDERYSISIRSPSGAIRNWSVGAHCSMLLKLMVNVEAKVGLPDDLAAWWKDRQHLALWEIQIKEAERQKNKKDASPEWIREMNELIDKREKTHEPIKNSYPHVIMIKKKVRR